MSKRLCRCCLQPLSQSCTNRSHNNNAPCLYVELLSGEDVPPLDASDAENKLVAALTFCGGAIGSQSPRLLEAAGEEVRARLEAHVQDTQRASSRNDKILLAKLLLGRPRHAVVFTSPYYSGLTSRLMLVPSLDVPPVLNGFLSHPATTSISLSPTLLCLVGQNAPMKLGDGAVMQSNHMMTLWNHMHTNSTVIVDLNTHEGICVFLHPPSGFVYLVRRSSPQYNDNCADEIPLKMVPVTPKARDVPLTPEEMRNIVLNRFPSNECVVAVFCIDAGTLYVVTTHFTYKYILRTSAEQGLVFDKEGVIQSVKANEFLDGWHAFGYSPYLLVKNNNKKSVVHLSLSDNTPDTRTLMEFDDQHKFCWARARADGGLVLCYAEKTGDKHSKGTGGERRVVVVYRPDCDMLEQIPFEDNKNNDSVGVLANGSIVLFNQ